MFTSDEAQTCSPAEIFLRLNHGISRPMTLLSQSVVGSAKALTPTLLCPDLLREKVWTGAAQLSTSCFFTVYSKLSKLVLAVLQLSS